jgi:PUA-domain protein
MKRTRIKAKDLNNLVSKYNLVFSKKEKIEKLEDKDKEFKGFSINDKCSFFYYDSVLLPTLTFLQHAQYSHILKKIVVDMGAIKFLIGGADIMRPGITYFDEGIQKGDFVVIVDENNSKAIALGLALESTQNMKLQEKGKVIKNIHYVGDWIWEL